MIRMAFGIYLYINRYLYTSLHRQRFCLSIILFYCKQDHLQKRGTYGMTRFCDSSSPCAVVYRLKNKNKTSSKESTWEMKNLRTVTTSHMFDGDYNPEQHLCFHSISQAKGCPTFASRMWLHLVNSECRLDFMNIILWHIIWKAHQGYYHVYL